MQPNGMAIEPVNPVREHSADIPRHDGNVARAPHLPPTTPDKLDQ